MMKKLLYLLTIFHSSFSVFGQQEIGIKANVGLSRIYNNENSPLTTLKIYFVPSGQGGIFYNFNFGNKSLLGAELLFIQINGKEQLDLQGTDIHGQPSGETFTDNTEKHISYLGLPIYYGFKIKKLTLNLGIQTSLVLMSGGEEKGQVPDGYGGISTWDNKFDKLYIDAFDFGARAGLIFNLTNKFSIEGTYYYGINNILQKDKYNSELKWKIQQMTIGLRYTFFTIKKKEKK
ncbi:MAG: PorT family protein [Bacteroidetes bacterium]|nr:PorT family protein [Bacteroidota bacterium]